MSNIKDKIAKLDELGPLESLCEKICNHVMGGTICNLNFFLCNAISYKKVTNIDMACPFAARGSAIVAEENGTLIILVSNGVHVGKSLSLKEIASP